MPYSSHEFSFVPGSISPRYFTDSLDLIMLKLPFIDHSILELQSALSMELASYNLTCVEVSISEFQGAPFSKRWL